MRGIEQRVRRHLSSDKKVHWHIDYFLQQAQIQDVFYKESNQKEECDVALSFRSFYKGFFGFGCTDCSCESHLFHASKQQLIDCIDELGFLLFSDDK